MKRALLIAAVLLALSAIPAGAGTLLKWFSEQPTWTVVPVPSGCLASWDVGTEVVDSSTCILDE